MRSFEERLTNHLEATALLATLIQPSRDQLRLDKLDTFSKKLLRRDYTIAFAGHFSAGKSSMINALTGESILPTSPIPTSANIVTLRQGETDEAIVSFHDRKAVRLASEDDLQHLRHFGRDGTVQQIDITHATSTLPPGLVLMDTPGVDSVDDAHRISTESALHVADLIFYVMDYNHVQSELNFSVTKDLLASVPELYLIVNQIDKHQTSELSFDAFKRSVEKSFAEHGVQPKGIFFTSLREPEFAGNDFSAVKQLVDQSIRDAQPKLIESAQTTLEVLHQEHINYLEDMIEEASDAMRDTVSATERAEAERLFDRHAQVKHQLTLFAPEQWSSRFSAHRESLLRNATLMPFELREKMKTFLESRQPAFKVGLFRSAKKTQATQQVIADDVLRALQSVTASEIALHLRKLMKQSLAEIDLLSDQHSLRIDQLPLDPPLAVIEEALQDGITITGESVLQFTNRVVASVSAWYVKETNHWREAVRQELTHENIPAKATLQAEFETLEQKCDVMTTFKNAEQVLISYLERANEPTTDDMTAAREQLEQWRTQLTQATLDIETFTGINPVVTQEMETTHEETLQAVPSRYTLEEMQQIQTILSGVRGFEDATKYLQQKLARVTTSDFTIALFGAFSAGKSSFCNALLGQRVLPVSPNPTTASINRIKPVTATHVHGTATIRFKSETDLLNDLNEALQTFDATMPSVTAVVTWLRERTTSDLKDASFLRAFLKGYPTVEPFIGTEQTVDQSAFEEYVAQEHLSCFVDVIDLYFDSPLTRLGITLVDTPGADSINARHTDVAFEYIKNADAILFVTYYNHAFARADREFLIQLGRVKDAFELDKMFFVVNAIDLATSTAEQQDVLHYVGTELKRFGIRAPRLFGVSSLNALAEKQQGIDEQSGIDSFEQAFHHFLNHDLKGLALQSLTEETDKTIHRLNQLIDQTERNIARKDARLTELDALEQEITAHFSNGRVELVHHELFAEIHELLHHVNQRIYYRFPDFFKEAYHPVRFANATKAVALQQALIELLGFLRYDFEQELRVTHFRIDSWIQRAIAKRLDEEAMYAAKLNPSFQLSPLDPPTLPPMTFSGPFQDDTKYRSVKSYFRNAKAFFERNEKEHLKDALVALTKPDAVSYLEGEESRLRHLTEQHLDEVFATLYAEWTETLLSQIETECSTLTDAHPLDSFKAAQAKLHDVFEQSVH